MNAPRTWADQLARLSSPVLSDLPGSGDAGAARAFAEGFKDSAGIRRPSDWPMLARLLRFDPEPAPGSIRERDRVWWAMFDGCSQGRAGAWPGEGPLVPEAREEGIEAWTEAELSALHALTHIAIRNRSEVIAARCASAIRWHLSEIQPDNGTNRPWAVHAFVLAGQRLPEALMHARTLVHNAIVERGRPERFGALLLLDASDALADAGALEVAHAF